MLLDKNLLSVSYKRVCFLRYYTEKMKISYPVRENERTIKQTKKAYITRRSVEHWTRALTALGTLLKMGCYGTPKSCSIFSSKISVECIPTLWTNS